MRPATTAIALLLVLPPAASASTQARDTVRLRVEWEVVEGQHPTADSLGRLSGIALDSLGFVYVSDIAANRVWVFDRRGRSVAAVGREGDGPGEFRSPTGIAIGPDGALYVRDYGRVTVFERDPAKRTLSKVARQFRGPLYPDWTSTRPFRFLDDVMLAYPHRGFIDRSERAAVYAIYRTTGEQVDSVVVPGFPEAPLTDALHRLPNGGRILRGLSHVPFAPLPSWDLTARGTLLLASGERYEITEVDRAGTVLRSYRRSALGSRIDAAEREDSLEALRERVQAVDVPWSEVYGVPPDVRALHLPTRYPPLMSVHATEGHLWVRRWVPARAGHSVFDVFDWNGAFVRVVVLPRVILSEPTPVLSMREIAAVGVDPESGALTVHRFTAR